MNIIEALTGAAQQFHFIRPYWLLVLLPAVTLSLLILRREKYNNAWQQYISPDLLAPLLQGQVNKPGKKLPLLAFLFWAFCALALAGPTWQKLPQPVEKRDSALVILMDLSPSMLAGDVAPSRLVAARHKILDLLQMRKEGNTALIAYSGDAHVVSPLTDDSKTIANLLNVLEPGMMPVYGSNVEHALTLALELFQRSGYTQGDILLVTDGITAQALKQSSALLSNKPFTLSIIGVGTEEGGPIPIYNGAGNGGFAKDSHGTIILPQLHAEQLKALAQNVHGYYSSLQLNDSDIQPLVTGSRFFHQSLFAKENTKKTDREFDQWRDIGAPLCLLLLPLALAAFRRGVLIAICCALPFMHTPPAEAAENKTSKFELPGWDDLWLNDNQRAMKAMKMKDYKNAAKHFKDPDWKASAQYEQGNYAAALKQFRNDSSAKGFYNQGNTLAKSGKLQDAISAYNEALKKNPQFDDAAFNKKIVEDLLKDQQKQQSQQNKDGQQGDQSQGQDKNNQEKDQNQQGSDQKNNDKKDQKPGDQQQDQNSKEDKDKGSNQEQNSSQDSAKKQKAHEEQDKNKSDRDAQLDKQQAQQKQLDQRADQRNPGQVADRDQSPSHQLSQEQKQALEQWLRQVPDDPSGLLRNKFEYYYQQRLQKQQQDNSANPMNDEERW